MLFWKKGKVHHVWDKVYAFAHSIYIVMLLDKKRFFLSKFSPAWLVFHLKFTKNVWNFSTSHLFVTICSSIQSCNWTSLKHDSVMITSAENKKAFSRLLFLKFIDIQITSFVRLLKVNKLNEMHQRHIVRGEHEQNRTSTQTAPTQLVIKNVQLDSWLDLNWVAYLQLKLESIY